MHRSCAVPLLLLPLALALPAGAVAASTTPSVKSLGWTTAPRLGDVSPQVKDKGKITACQASGNGQRDVNYVFKARLPRKAKIGIGLWVTGTSFQSIAPRIEPSNAELMKTAGKWGKKPDTKFFQSAYGLTFAKGPFGPENINGNWFAKVVVDGKVLRRASVTIACAN